MWYCGGIEIAGQEKIDAAPAKTSANAAGWPMASEASTPWRVSSSAWVG